MTFLELSKKLKDKCLFVRYHTTEGNGIRLALCKKIAARHNIKFDVKSTPHLGTSFTFIIPINNI